MQYSIIIPVFNKAALTKQCLDALQASISDAGDGEVIVVDNASTDNTQELLKTYPWLTVLRNETNTGFARANNQAATIARGEFLVLLNNDTVPHPGWLRQMLDTARKTHAGAVGARLLFPNRTIQHAGVIVSPVRLGRIDVVPTHFSYRRPAEDPMVMHQRSMSAVTAACVVTPREVYDRVGGLDEQFWNGYEDVDFCFKVRKLGFEIVYEPSAVVTHFESQSGAHRFRQANWNTELLSRHWNGRVSTDDVATYLAVDCLARARRTPRGGFNILYSAVPRATILVQNVDHRRLSAIRKALRGSKIPLDDVIALPKEAWFTPLSSALEHRGARYVCFIDGAAELEPGWLDALVATVEWSENIGAATAAPTLRVGEDVVATEAAARCTLIAMDRFPQHHRPRAFPTVDGTIADFLHRSSEFGLTVRGVAHRIGNIPVACDDPEILRVHGFNVGSVPERSDEEVEAIFAKWLPKTPSPTLVSIVTLSWNALEYTQLALESIRKHTTVPYEIIVVDNGSDEVTVSWLREQSDVRVTFNSSNRGFAGGNNQGIAAARGDFLIILNNDVLVTDGWVEGLLAPFGRLPGLGMTAPRSNRVAGSQQLEIVSYTTNEEYQIFAQQMRKEFSGTGWLTDRAIGFCLCIDRRVITEVGGFDEGYAVGNFEDDDFSLRVRSAGYKILICDDVVIHHFGSKTFTANNINYSDTMQRNWARFSEKWGFPPTYPVNGYNSALAIERGFNREKHFSQIALEPLRFVASIRDESQWENVASFVKRYVRAFTNADAVVLDIAVLDDMDPEVIGKRIERLLDRAGLDVRESPEIEIGYEASLESWRAAFVVGRTLRIAQTSNPVFADIPFSHATSRNALRTLLAQADA